MTINQTTFRHLAGREAFRRDLVTTMTPEVWTPDMLMNVSGHVINLTGSVQVGDNAEMPDDAIWILTSTFIIFTMQSGQSPSCL